MKLIKIKTSLLYQKFNNRCYIDHRCLTIRHVLRGQTQKRINTVANYVSDYCTSYSKGGYKFYPFIRRKESPKLTNFFLSDRAAFCLWTFLISPFTKCLHSFMSISVPCRIILRRVIFIRRGDAGFGFLPGSAK